MTKTTNPLPEVSPTGFRRRAVLNLMTPAEESIFNCIQSVEELGADPLLTDAVVGLGRVHDLVADWLEGKSGLDAPQSPAPRDATDIRVRIEEDIVALRAGKQTRESSLAITQLQVAHFWLDEVNRLS